MTLINFQALVLAGSRAGVDPVADAAGVPAKALVPVRGHPMLFRVVSALSDSDNVGQIDVVGLPALGAAQSAVDARLRDSGASTSDGRQSPAMSVAASLAVTPPGAVLVTTADHALLQTAIVDEFATLARNTGADVVIGIVRYELVRAVCPGTDRTVTHFREGDYCGCNLYAFLTPAGRDAVRFWFDFEKRRKNPARIAKALGLWTLLRYALRRLTIDAAMARLSKLCGARVAAVQLSFGEAAIDVDKPEDLEVAEAVAAQLDL